MKEKIKIYFKENKKLFIGIFIGIILVLFLLIILNVIEKDYGLTSCQAKCYDKYYPNPFSYSRCLSECNQKYPQEKIQKALPWLE